MLRVSEGLGVGAGGVRRGRGGRERQGLQQIQTHPFRTKGAWQGDAGNAVGKGNPKTLISSSFLLIKKAGKGDDFVCCSKSEKKN